MSKAGYLKTSKNIGKILQKYGQTTSDFFSNPMVERGFEFVGKAAGKAIPVPLVGGIIGEYAGKQIPRALSYGSGLVGEIGGMMAGEKDIKDVLNYLPNRYWEDFKNDTINSDAMKVIRGEMNWRDAVINRLEDEAMIDFLSDKQHAWKDKEGNYHNEYVPGSTMVVGKWEEQPNTQPRPDINSNEGIMGIGKNGEILIAGFDSA